MDTEAAQNRKKQKEKETQTKGEVALLLFRLVHKHSFEAHILSTD